MAATGSFGLDAIEPGPGAPQAPVLPLHHGGHKLHYMLSLFILCSAIGGKVNK